MTSKRYKAALTIFLLLLFIPSSLLAIPLSEDETGLQVEAPKKYTLKYNGDGTYTVKKKKSKNKATFVFGISPMSAKLTADDYIESTNAKVKKYQEFDDSVLLTLKKLGKKKNVQVRFRPVGDEGEMEITTYTGKNKKKKKQKRRSLERTRDARNLRITLGAIRALDRIIRSRQGGRRVVLPVNVPTRQLVGRDGTSALVPDLPGWSWAAQDGIISGGNPTQGIANLGIPTLVLIPGNFFTGPVMSPIVPPNVAIQNVWPQQAASLGAQLQVLGIQQIPGTDGWLGTNFVSGLFAVRFATLGRTWQALMVSGVAPIDGFSWLWYHSYIAVPEVGGSPAIGTALMNTWGTWDNSNANLARLQDALNTLSTTVVPGNPIDPVVFDRIHQQWVDYIRGN